MSLKKSHFVSVFITCLFQSNLSQNEPSYVDDTGRDLWLQGHTEDGEPYYLDSQGRDFWYDYLDIQTTSIQDVTIKSTSFDDNFDISDYNIEPNPPTNNHPHDQNEILIDDQMFTFHQSECFFNRDKTDETCGEVSRGYDKTVQPWYKYFNDYTKTYEIPIYVHIDTYPDKMKQQLWNSLKWSKNHYKENTNIELVFIDKYMKNSGSYRYGFINIKNVASPCGCCSAVGLDMRKKKQGQDMFVNWCFNMPGKVTHEIMHALGWVHEHQRPDRDKFLSVGNKKESSAFNCGVISHLELSDTPYDLGSIMHYNKGGSCQISLRPEYRGRRIGQRDGFSELDKKEINNIYPATGPRENI